MRTLLIALALLTSCNDSPSPLAQARGFASEPSPRTTDLLSEPCAPGSTVTTGVNLAPGATADPASLAFTGEAFGKFTIVSTTQTGTWFAVTARNTGAGTIQMRAAFTYKPPRP